MGADPVSLGVELAAIALPKLGGLFRHEDRDFNRAQRDLFERIGGHVRGASEGARRGRPEYYFEGQRISRAQARALLRSDGISDRSARTVRPGDIPLVAAGVYASVDDYDPRDPNKRNREAYQRGARMRKEKRGYYDDLLDKLLPKKRRTKRKRIKNKSLKALIAAQLFDIAGRVWDRYAKHDEGIGPGTPPPAAHHGRRPRRAVISVEEGGRDPFFGTARRGQVGRKVQVDAGAWSPSSSRPRAVPGGPAGGVKRSTSGPPRPKSISRSLPKPVITPTKVEYKYPLPTSGPGAASTGATSMGVKLPKRSLPPWAVPVLSGAVSAYLAPKPRQPKLGLVSDPWQDTGGLTSFQSDVSPFAGNDVANDPRCKCGPKKKRKPPKCRNKRIRSKTYTRDGRKFQTITRELICRA